MLEARFKMITEVANRIDEVELVLSFTEENLLVRIVEGGLYYAGCEYNHTPYLS